MILGEFAFFKDEIIFYAQKTKKDCIVKKWKKIEEKIKEQKRMNEKENVKERMKRKQIEDYENTYVEEKR